MSAHSGCDQLTSFLSGRVILQVGERSFITLASTLCEGSTFFASLLSERWADSRLEDGSYFIDANPDLFAHILCYLRRRVLPIIYDKVHGFDHSFYRALCKEAKYFGVRPLFEWIEANRYLHAVVIQYSVEKVKGGIHVAQFVDGNTERWYYPIFRTEKIYQCPRGISQHHGKPNAYGKACEKVKDEDEDEYMDQNVLSTLIVTKKLVFDITY